MFYLFMLRPLYIAVFLLLFSCDAVTTTLDGDEEEPEQETYFQRGEYGGSSLLNKEDIYNITFSNNGERVAMIRRRNPNDFSEPTGQLWITDKYGRNPEFIASGLGTISWSDDDSQLAVTYSLGPGYNFIFIIDLEKRTATQLTGSPGHELYSYTTVNPQWIPGKTELFLNVWTKSWSQSYDPGVYIYDLVTKEYQGPLGNWPLSASAGNYGEYFVSAYNPGDNVLRNMIYNLETHQTTDIVPDIPGSEYRIYRILTPNPRGREILLQIRQDNAEQLVKTTSELGHFKLLTEFGGHNPRWMSDGNFVFIRDIHKAPGAHNVPHKYDMETGEISKLWEQLPGYVPEFPPVSQFNPIPIHVDW